MKELTKWWPVILVGLLLFVFLFSMREVTPPPGRPSEVAYSEFKQLLRDHRVSSISLAEHVATATLKPRADDPSGAPGQRIQVNLPTQDDAELMPLIESSGAVLAVEPPKEEDLQHRTAYAVFRRRDQLELG